MDVGVPGLDASTDAATDAAADATADAEVATDAAGDAAFPDAGQVTLVVVRDGDGQGTVGASELGIDCGTSCSAQVSIGTPVMLTATPADGSELAAFGAPCVGSGTQCAFVVDQPTTVAVTFVRSRFPVTVAVVGPGAGRIDDDQGELSCTGTCTGHYLPGTAVTFTPTATSGPFQGWTGACTGSSPCALVADAARTLRAVFGHLAVVTALPFGSGAANEFVRTLRVADDGDVYLTGYHRQSASFGGLPMPWAGQTDAFVARVDGTTGAPRWVRSIGGAGWDWGAGLAIAGDRLYVGVAFEGAVDLGAGEVSVSETSAAVIAMDLDGEVAWVRSLPGVAGQGRVYPTALALGDDGRLYAAGNYYGSVDFGVGLATDAEGLEFNDGWLLALDPDDGEPQWLRTVNAPYHTGVGDVAARPEGGVVLGGYADGAVDLGGGPVTPTTTGADGDDAYVAALDADGGHLWSRALGGPDDDDLSRIVLSDGDVFVGGSIGERIDFGAGQVIEVVPGFDQRYLARLDGANGATVWAIDPGRGGRLADVRGERVWLTGGFETLRLALVDAATGVLTSSRSVPGPFEGGPAALAGDHAWAVVRLWGLGALDGLARGAVSTTSPESRWLVRVGL